MNTNRIQVQVVRGAFSDAFTQQCVDSLTPEPVDIIYTEFMPHLESRLQFVEQATSPLISLIDTDDWVVAGVYDKLLSAYDSNPNAIGAYSYEQKVTSSGDVVGGNSTCNVPFTLEGALQRCHFARVNILDTEAAQAVVRLIRKLPQDFSRYLYPEFSILAGAGVAGDWVHIPEIGYNYRQHGNQMHRNQNHNWFRSYTKRFIRSCMEEFKRSGAGNLG